MVETFPEILIAEVKKRPVLWDIRHKNYRNRFLVDREWSLIATELNEAKEVIKGKWKNLRDNFKKELRKCPVPEGDAHPSPVAYTGSWCHFEAMFFLRPVIREPQYNHPLEDTMSFPESFVECKEEFSQSSGMEFKEYNSDTQQSEDQCEEYTLENLAGKKRKYQGHLNYSPRYAEDLLDPRKMLVMERKEEEDDDLCFFKSLLPYVKQLSPIKKLQFRSKIQNVLAEEMNKLENGAPSHP